MRRKLLESFIQQVVEQELDELAVPASQAEASGLALFVGKNGSLRTFVLYRPDQLFRTFELDNAVDDLDRMEDPAKAIVIGMIEIMKAPACNSWVVSYVAAQKGYGPLMYEIAFSYVGGEGLTSERQLVSAHARKVWNYNFQKRKEDFDVIPLPDTPACNFADGDQLGQDKALQFKYILKNPINTDTMEDRNADILNNIKSQFGGKPELYLRKLSNKFFSMNYGS